MNRLGIVQGLFVGLEVGTEVLRVVRGTIIFLTCCRGYLRPWFGLRTFAENDKKLPKKLIREKLPKIGNIHIYIYIYNNY